MNWIQTPGNAKKGHWVSFASVAVVILLIVLVGVGLYRLGREMTNSFAQASKISSVTFEGETFGRTLSGEVERKKLDKPLGLIDEIMLQSRSDSQRRFSHVFARKYLDGMSREEAIRAVDETADALEKRYDVKLSRVSPGFRGAACRKGFANGLCFEVWNQHNFFQDEYVLNVYVYPSGTWREPSSRLLVDEVMGHRIGASADGDGRPRRPFWKFETVVKQDSVGDNVTEGIYAVHSVSNLDLAAAVAELDEAKSAIENLHGIVLRQDVDYDTDTEYSFVSQFVDIGLWLEYQRNKVIRYHVIARGDFAEQIRGHVPASHRLIFLMCLCVVMLGLVFLALRRTPKEAFFRGWRLYAVMSGTADRAEYVLFGRVCNLVSYALIVVVLLSSVLCFLTLTRPVSPGMMSFSFWALTGCAWIAYGYWIALIPAAIAMWIRHRRAKKLGVEGAVEFTEPSRCPPFFASPVFRGALGIAAFFCGVAVCYVLQGGRVDDPIVGRSIPFFGLYASFVFGLMCTMTAFALDRRGLPKGIFANVLGVLALLLIAFLIHLEDAFVFCGHGFTLASAARGFLARLAPFAVLLLCAWMLLSVFLYVLHCLPIVRGILANSGQTARAFVARLVALTAWICLMAFVVYELLILIAFTSYGWWTGR